jgi:Tol biopolymer transport system component
MKKWLFLGLAVAAGAAAAFVYSELFYSGGPLSDADCPKAAPVFVATVPHDVRRYDLAAIDPETGKETRLSKDHASWDGAVSPDGKEIVFVTGRDGSWDEAGAYHTSSLYLMEIDGSNQRRLVEGKHFEDPAWSPDGEWIAFAGDVDRREANGIFVVRRDGTDLRKLVATFEFERHYSPTWSPNGDRIAFVYGAVDEGGTIHVVDVDAKGEYDSEAVTTFQADIDQLDWSPSGDTLVFDALGSNPTSGVYLLELGSGDPDLAFANARSPAWSPDGDRIVHFSGRAEGPYRVTISTPSGRGRIDLDKSYRFDSSIDDISWTRCST